jgi:glycosyltransferase involved in cell wall biosynthesis
MKLVIVSNMAHYRVGDQIVGHGATARELDALATLFDEVRHVACLHDELAPASALPYRAKNIELVPLPPAGGDQLVAKLDIVRHLPTYTRVIARELRDADAVHVRCPANVTLCALAVLAASRKPARRWVKYAGSWQATPAESPVSALQRRWLARPHLRAQVTVNGAWPGQPAHVHSFDNPSLTDEELATGRAIARTKSFGTPLRLLFVGHLGAAKNPRTAIDALARLRDRGLDARLDLAGEGTELAAMRGEVTARGLALHVTLHGALPRPALDELYARAHFVVLPSATEGWPKVLAEGMAFGAVPVATAVGSVPAILGELGVGGVIATPSAAAFADAIASYDAATWQRESAAAVDGARRFGYAAYLDAVRRLLGL